MQLCRIITVGKNSKGVKSALDSCKPNLNINNYFPPDQNSLSIRLVTCDELRAKAEDIFFEKYDYKEFIAMLE